MPKIHDSILTNVDKIERENLKNIEAKVYRYNVAQKRIVFTKFTFFR